MLWLQDVPNFKWILIHSLNNDDQTSGCLGVGDTQQDLDINKNGFIGQSRNAYKKMYPKVRDALLNGEKVTIKYSKINLAEEISNDSPPEMIHPDFVKEDISEIKGMMIQLLAKLEGKNIT